MKNVIISYIQKSSVSPDFLSHTIEKLVGELKLTKIIDVDFSYCGYSDGCINCEFFGDIIHINSHCIDRKLYPIDSYKNGTNSAGKGYHTYIPFFPKVECNDIYEFYIYCLAHEFRHSWQFRNKKEVRSLSDLECNVEIEHVCPGVIDREQYKKDYRLQTLSNIALYNRLAIEYDAETYAKSFLERNKND